MTPHAEDLSPTFNGVTSPDLAQFRALATNRRVIPVVRKLLADGETPVGLYQKLAGQRSGTFLLESAEHGQSWSRYSFVGVRCAAMLTERNGEAVWVGNAPQGVRHSGDPAEVLRHTIELLHTEPLNGLPPLTSGMVGYLTYDLVRRWERIPNTNPDELGTPELGMLLATDLAVLDHHDGSVLLIANAINYDATHERVDEAYDNACARLDRMQHDLEKASEATAVTYDQNALGTQQSRTTSEEYQANVERVKEYIRAGDAFQVVLSQRFEATCQASALDVYRILRVMNPSPYMYLFRIPTLDDAGHELSDEVAFDIVGSSPEALVTVNAGRALLHPIAGTRKRGTSPKEDQELADDLLQDTKERAEHLMLVDLGRNDLGRVCAPGTVDVVEFMQVERYSHVMHLVSTVVGQLGDGMSAYDALAATFPAGTLSGAPKPRAMEIIDELESTMRGVYGGAVGYFDFHGDLDAAIAIRTAVIKDGVAYVQAGAGVVADSSAQAEDQECRNKAAALLNAIAVAQTLKKSSA